MMASSINQKIDEYWNIVDSATRISAILDPRTKLAFFKSGQPTTDALNDLRMVMDRYYLPLPTPPTHTNIENTKSTTRNWFNNAKRRRIDATFSLSSNNNETNSSIASELDRYIALPCDENVVPLIWWQGHQREFPVLSCIARDYLSIQATSVACEQAFSIATNTITKTRNRLHPTTARASLCVKSWIANNIGEKLT
jgi:hypothetical protein